MQGLLKKSIILMLCIMLAFAFASVNAYADDENLTQDPAFESETGNNTDEVTDTDQADSGNAAGTEDPDKGDALTAEPQENNQDKVTENKELRNDINNADPAPSDEPEEENSEPAGESASAPSKTLTLTLTNGAEDSSYSDLQNKGVIYTLIKAGELVETDTSETFGKIDGIVFYKNRKGKELFMYAPEHGVYGYLMDYEGNDISYDITDEVREAMQKDIDENESYDQGFRDMVQEIIDYYKTVKLVFQEVHVLTINTEGLGWITYCDADYELSYEKDDLATSVVEPYAGTYRIGALPDEDWEFVKWTLNGKDYSEEPEITFTLGDEDASLIAVFEYTGDYGEETIDYETPIAPTSGGTTVKKHEVPKTGDTSGIEYFALLFAASLGALVISAKALKKNR